MFDKIPSIKDFVIYLIPGILTCYFGLSIANYFLKEKGILTIGSFGESSVLSFVGIIFSFLVGFLIAQIQLIVVNDFILKNYRRKIRTIKNSGVPIYLKSELLIKVKDTFAIKDIDDTVLMEDEAILYLCLNYVKTKCNEDNKDFINRSSYLASFSTVLVIPVLLGLWAFLLNLDISICAIILFLFSIGVVVVLITYKITDNFHREWINSIYRQFLVLKCN